MEATENKYTDTLKETPKRKTNALPEKKRLHPRWIEFQKLKGTGEILDMRAVLK